VTTSPNKALQEPAYNSSRWDTPLNANFVNTDSAFGGVQAFNLASASGTISVSGSVYVGPYPANTPSYIPLIFSLTGALTAAVKLQIPSGVGGRWLCNNMTTGAFAVTIASAGGGATITATQGQISDFYSDGTNIYAIGTNTVPTGTLLPFSGASAPTGYLLSYGQSLSTTTYSQLFGVIGYTFGGSGSNFNTPKMNGRTIAAPDNMGGTAAGVLTGLVRGTMTGQQSVALTVAQMPYHNHFDVGHAHAVSDPGHVHGGIPTLGAPFGGGGVGVTGAYGNSAAAATGIAIATGYANISATGGNGAHTNVQPTIGINYVIKT